MPAFRAVCCSQIWSSLHNVTSYRVMRSYRLLGSLWLSSPLLRLLCRIYHHHARFLILRLRMQLLLASFLASYGTLVSWPPAVYCNSKQVVNVKYACLVFPLHVCLAVDSFYRYFFKRILLHSYMCL
jgi:hypothetical protein